jgi:phage terminase small subunit
MFVEEYLIDLNLTQAAIRAGYSPKTANQIGEETIKKPHVAAAIAERMKARQERLEITQDMVLRELAKLGFANMLDYMRPSLVDGSPTLDFSNITRDQAAALAEVTVEEFMDGKGDSARPVRRTKFKLADKRGALVDIGKHIGMFVDRSIVTHVHEKVTDGELDAALAAQEKVLREAGISLH